MRETCDLCRRADLVPMHELQGSAGRLEVFLCNHCGLVQSLLHTAPPFRRMAGDAGTSPTEGRERKLRAEAALAALRRHVNFNTQMAILDVGSRAGSFVHALLEAAPEAVVTAIEPEEAMAEHCARLDRTDVIRARIEDAALETGRFEIVHSCQMLQQLAAPSRVLADHWRVLKSNGLLIVDVPNIALLDSKDFDREWFAANHLYHFSARTLMRLVSAAGFVIIAPPDVADRENLLIVARKIGGATRPLLADPREVSETTRLICAYRTARGRASVRKAA